MYSEKGGAKMLRYKKKIIEELKAAGYNTNRLRKEKLLPESSIQSLRENAPISWQSIDRICAMLQCQPGDIIEYVEEAPNS